EAVFLSVPCGIGDSSPSEKRCDGAILPTHRRDSRRSAAVMRRTATVVGACRVSEVFRTFQAQRETFRPFSAYRDPVPYETGADSRDRKGDRSMNKKRGREEKSLPREGFRFRGWVVAGIALAAFGAGSLVSAQLAHSNQSGPNDRLFDLRIYHAV